MSVIRLVGDMTSPYDNIQKMFKAFSKGDVVKGVSEYYKSVPGVLYQSAIVKYALRKASFVPGSGINFLTKDKLVTSIDKVVKWYTQPASWTAQKAGTTAKAKIASNFGAKAGTAGAILAAYLVAQHGVTRLSKRNDASFLDLAYKGIGLPETKSQKRVSDSQRPPAKWYDYILRPRTAVTTNAYWAWSKLDDQLDKNKSKS